MRSVQLTRGRGGYGFTLSGQVPCRISWIAELSSGESAGLQRGDGIVGVNGEKVYDASHEHVVKLIGMSADLLQLEVEESGTSIYSSSDDDDLETPLYLELHNKRRATQKPPHRIQSKLTGEDGYDFKRTERVLNELKDGTLFQSMQSALDNASPSEKVFVATSGRSSQESGPKMKKHKLREQGNKSSHTLKKSMAHPNHDAKMKQPQSRKRNLSLPADEILKNNYNANSSNNMFSESVVAYLGTVEIVVKDRDDIPDMCLAGIESCVQQLRREQHIHQRVVLKILQSSVKLCNADGDTIAVYDGQQICFTSSCPDDDRFFCIATLHGENQVRCHQFMVDPDICAHRSHAEKAKRFGIHCSTDSETGNCVEFPQSPRIILKMVEALFDSQQNFVPVFDNVEASAKNSVMQALETDDVVGNSMTTTDTFADGMNGSAVRMQSHIQQYIANRTKKEAANNKPSQRNLKHHDLSSGGDHDATRDADFNRYVAMTGELPSIVKKTQPRKYRGGADTLPLQRSLAPSGSGLLDVRTLDIRSTKRGKKGGRNGDGSFFRVPKRSSNRQLKLNMKNMMSKSSESIPLSEAGRLSGSSSIESLGSNASLPSCFNGSGITNLETAGPVSIWAITFDRLLEDPIGVKYFTEFLRKEFSQENILFWLECERLKKVPAADTPALKEIADSIYERFLCAQATSPVNIDSKGQRSSEEALTKPPHPDMFEQQQNQIYRLMKLDSYSRFLKSQLYRRCLMCQVEGLPLPLEPEARKDSPTETRIENRHSFSLKHRRFFLRKPKKNHGSSESIHRDSSDSECGSVDTNTNSNRPADDTARMHQVGVDASLICRLILWDGCSTVLYAEEGKATIREALTALCEKRSVPLSAVDIYYQNEDRPLALDQDVAVLAGQEVRVERRTLFRLDLLPIGRSVGVKAKPTKSTEEVLRPVVAKYGLEFEDLQTRLSGEKDVLDLTKTVSALDGLRIVVDYAPENSQDSSKGTLRKSKSQSDQKGKEKKSHRPGQRDMDELINLMSSAQNGKMHDQRGLLSEMNLELPDFLKTPTPSPTKRSVTATGAANSNNNNKENSDLTLPSVDYAPDVSLAKAGKLSPNPMGNGNAKARIQKMKHLLGGSEAKHATLPNTKTFQWKKVSANDTDATGSEHADVDDDLRAVPKWMQSVSCTPKYRYARGLDNASSGHRALDNGSTERANATIARDLSFDDESAGTENLPTAVAHDHRYTKRKGKVGES